MRTSAIALAFLALTIVPVSLQAGDDFSALLADLSFGDAPALDAADSLTVAQDDATVAELKPVPTGIMMPELLEGPAPKAPQPQAVQAPQVALQDPVPVSAPETDERVDLDAAFALQSVQPAESTIPAKTVGHHGAHHYGGHACGPTVTCRPHNKVNLPSSSFIQYFRSNACNTNVWDGYQQKCRCGNKHVNGQCDCFNKGGKCGSCGGCGCAGGACDGCDG